MRKTVLAITLACACTTLHAPLLAAESTPGEIPYVSGGIGEEELAVIQLVRNDFNLHLLFADKSGAYLSGVEVVITAAPDRRLLDIQDAGPFLFVRLPAGSYRIQARYAGQPAQQTVTLRPSQASDFVFRW